jgi:hypothetical protein
MDETECPVMTGRAPHNADGTQITEMTKGPIHHTFPTKHERAIE